MRITYSAVSELLASFIMIEIYGSCGEERNMESWGRAIHPNSEDTVICGVHSEMGPLTRDGTADTNDNVSTDLLKRSED